MPLSQEAVDVLTRPIPAEKIKERAGKAGLTFYYVTPVFVIETLNEAFAYNWDTSIVYSQLHDGVAVVGLELKVVDETGIEVRKQQFGSCEITRGLGIGEAFKGAASDALKKCATLLGLGLELYQADEAPGGPPPTPQFRKPNPSSRPQPGPKAPPAPAPVSAPTGRPVTSPGPAKPTNPFEQEHGAPTSERVSRPAPQVPAHKPAPPQGNPFGNSTQASGPNATQMNALQNLANRRGVSAPELISLAGVVDLEGNPVLAFEDLSREDAIAVIKAAQS